MLQLLNVNDTPNQILYVVKKEGYMEAIQKVDIHYQPLNQTHVIYLNPVITNSDDTGK